MKKTLIISAWAPPMTGGSPTLLGKFLRKFKNGSYIFLTNDRAKYFGALSGSWLPATYYFAGQDKPESKFPAVTLVEKTSRSRKTLPQLILARVLRSIYEFKDVASRIISLRDQANRIIDQEDPDVILGTSDDGVFLIASYLSAKFSGKTLYIHLLDLYARNNYSTIKKLLANYFEGKILRYASKVFVTNDKTSRYYKKLYGINPIVISHITSVPKSVRVKSVSKSPVISYTGAVYWAQRDAIANLVTSLKEIPEAKFKIYSGTTEDELRRIGVWSSQVEIAFTKDTEIQKEQSKADILFLPMGFNTPAKDIVRTAAPGKMPEYMVSGVPILVHAASDDYIAEYARKEGWGLVVDKNDPHLLAKAVKKLINDNSLRKRLVKRAFQVAREHHDQDKVIPIYLKHFQ